MTLPLTIAVTLGAPSEPGVAGIDVDSDSLDTVALEAIEPDPDYDDRPGYDPTFLGFSAPLPALTEDIHQKAELLKHPSSQTDYVLNYHHYSTIVNGERRLAFLSAVNYLPGAPFHHIREVRDKWFFDPRLDKDAQAGNEFYARNPLDRGHLVRRADAAWGQTEEEAKLANDDTFHWTNCSPQHEIFNQSSRATHQGLLLWGNIENHISRQDRRRLSIFNGPVFRNTDRKYKGLKVPRQFWKVVVFENEAGDPEALAFVFSQRELIKDLPAEEFVVGPFAAFQVKLRKIETLTKLDFGDLKSHDPLELDVNELFFESQTEFVPLASLDDIVA